MGDGMCSLNELIEVSETPTTKEHFFVNNEEVDHHLELVNYHDDTVSKQQYVLLSFRSTSLAIKCIHCSK